MKLISKTYLLVAILIGAAAVNLFLFYQDTTSSTTQSYSIIRVGDIKVSVQSISNLAVEVANQEEEFKEELETEYQQVEEMIRVIQNGGTIKGQSIERIPPTLIPNFNDFVSSWESFKEKAKKVEVTSAFDPEATASMDYILQKNNDLVLLTNQMMREFEGLDRDYNRHKQIAEELAECAVEIGQQTLLIKIGEGESAQEELKEKKLKFEIGIRKLLQISTVGLDVESVGMEHEELIPIARENSASLRQLDPLWESLKTRITIIEDKGLVSPEFATAKNEMESQREILYSDIDQLLQDWNLFLTSQGSEEQTIIQMILVIDIAVFFIVLYVIRQSLNPLESITNALSRVKEGVYGEKIDYKGEDEVGQLVSSFNIMSDTIKEKEEEAKKTDIAKDEFLAMITHELKTPLVPIQGYSDILLNEHLGKLTDKQKERISIIKSSSETLLSIISDLLDAQKLELGQLRMKKEKVNIKNTIEKAIESMKPEADQNNITITNNAVDQQVEHDPERIRQVITNLLKNSLTAVEPNTGKIDVIMENLPTEVKISVKDNGIGIPIEKQKDLFKKFYQVDATLTRERGGSGLGLAICKGIVDNHLGQISVQSVPNQGATFTFTIPKETSEQAKSPIGTA